MSQATADTATLNGYVERVGDRGYGFIMTDRKHRVFFHIKNVKGRYMPKPGSAVVVTVMRNVAPGKNLRAASVNVVSPQ